MDFSLCFDEKSRSTSSLMLDGVGDPIIVNQQAIHSDSICVIDKTMKKKIVNSHPLLLSILFEIDTL